VKVGLYAGSFDPVHLGHVALITTASEKFDRFVVVVAANPQKRTGMFSVPERVQMLEEACRHLGNVTDVVKGLPPPSRRPEDSPLKAPLQITLH
jgi:cytidyltransferase-like protein